MANDCNKDLFSRIAIALEGGEIPTIEDAVTLEQLVIQYWEKEYDLLALSLVSRVANRITNINKLDKVRIQSLVNHLVQQRMPDDGAEFANLLRCYVDGHITASDLLGERERKARGGHGWQHYDQIGEMAEFVHTRLERRLETGNRSISNGLNINLYNFLSDLSIHGADVEMLRKKYKLPKNTSITTITTGFLSPSQWRDCHQEFKKYF